MSKVRASSLPMPLDEPVTSAHLAPYFFFRFWLGSSIGITLFSTKYATGAKPNTQSQKVEDVRRQTNWSSVLRSIGCTTAHALLMAETKAEANASGGGDGGGGGGALKNIGQKLRVLFQIAISKRR